MGHEVSKKPSESTPRRTREHVIASQSHNYIEKFIIDKGHTLDRPTDYGTDLLMNTFDERGYVENGHIKIQLKASDNISYSQDGSTISFPVDLRHYRHWIREPMPVFLILYDARRKAAYWLYFQSYFLTGPGRQPKELAKSVTVRIPVKNFFGEQAVDYMRE